MRHDEALTATEKGMKFRGGLAADNPDAHLSDFSLSLILFAERQRGWGGTTRR